MKKKLNFLKDVESLRPDNAVAAILIDTKGNYLLQKRDDITGIFYPGFWGCFGGGLERTDKDKQTAINRELYEEIGLYISPNDLNEFTSFTFDFSFADIGILERTYYVCSLSSEQIKDIRLGEGADFKFFAPEDILIKSEIVPYDQYALWLYYSRSRFNMNKIK